MPDARSIDTFWRGRETGCKSSLGWRNNIRILQITDLHILPEADTKLYGVDTYRSLQSVLASAFALDHAPEAIIASGDLAEDGSQASYRRLQDVLAATGLPVFVLPGNHDDVANMEQALVGGSIKMQTAHSTGGWKLVFLNSQIPGESHGRVTDDALRALRDDLENNPDTQYLIALHHPPIAPCQHPVCQLEAADDFLDSLGAFANVKAVISGHAHLEDTTLRGHLTLMTTPATCAQASHGVTPKTDTQTWGVQADLDLAYDDFKATHRVDPTRHGYRILDLLPDGSFTTQVHWVASQKPFSTP